MTEVLHLKLEHSEAVQAKRDILTTEANLLRISKIIKQYSRLRTNELIKKRKIYQKSVELKNNFKKLQATLPKIKVHPLLRDETPERKVQILKMAETPEEKSIEAELKSIQEKLKGLQ